MSRILQIMSLRIILTIYCVFIVLQLNAQVTQSNAISGYDTLTLQQIMEVVIGNHPYVKAQEELVNKADARIGIARSGYYPSVNASLNVSHVEPVPEIPFNGQNFQLFPNNNFDAGLNVYENIYDFGKTASLTAMAKATKDLMQDTLESTKQNLALGVVRNYYTLIYLQEAIKITDEQLKILQQHLDFVKKKKLTGSGTQYDILSTQVKISNVENQKLDFTAFRDVQLALLNSLLGLPARTFHTVKDTLNIKVPDIPDDSLITYALSHRNEMAMAQKKTDLANLHLDVIKSHNRPSVNFIAQGGWKNGYPFDVNKIRPYYLVGVGIQVPIYDGTRLKYNLMDARASVEGLTQLAEITRRHISSEVVENQTRLLTSSKKLQQSELKLSQAQEAYKLAETNYSAGINTNLDLLDASSNVSQSKLDLLKAQTDYAINVYAYEASLGEQVY